MNNKSPLVSIGLFVYNGERFLRPVLDSLLAQTFQNFELIISDNASIDSTGEICREYASRDQRIRYYRNERNMGAGWNVRRVYDLATGKYFKWAASDDYCAPEFLERCVEALEADSGVVLAHTRTRVIDDKGQFLEDYDVVLRTGSHWPLERLSDLLLIGHRCYQIFGVIRLDALHRLPPQGSYVHSDRVLLLQLGLLGRFHEVPEFLFTSTKHSGQSVWTLPARVRSRHFRLTRLHGTLPGIEWWDPNKLRKLSFPEWRVLREYAVSIMRAKLGFWGKLRGYVLLTYWIHQNHRRMIKDLVVAADQLLYRLQTSRTAAELTTN